jgi:hypothetical protein
VPLSNLWLERRGEGGEKEERGRRSVKRGGGEREENAEREYAQTYGRVKPKQKLARYSCVCVCVCVCVYVCSIHTQKYT